jgi:hypothetical protein
MSMTTSVPNLYIRNIIPDGTSIPLPEHLTLSGRGYGLSFAGFKGRGVNESAAPSVFL